jgi:O-antigen ligase
MTIVINNVTFHIFELPFLVICVGVLLYQFVRQGGSIRLYEPRLLILYLVAAAWFLSSILLSGLFAENGAIVIKSFFKWSEVFFLSLLIFLLRGISNFKRLYWLLFFACFGFPLLIFISIALGIESIEQYRVFSGYEPLFALILLIPFIFEKGLVYKCFAFLCLIALIFSLSRGAWIAALPAFFYILFRIYQRNRLLALMLPVGAIFLVLTIFPSLLKLVYWKLAAGMDLNSASNVERIGLLKISWDAFKSSPVFGIGALNFSGYILSSGMMGSIKTTVVSTLTPHNFFLQLLAEEGLYGFLAFIAVLVSLLWIQRRVHERKLEPSKQKYLIGLRFLFLSYILAISVGYVAGHFRFIFALLIGLILSFLRVDHEND